jgi:D-alanyl-D-alanine carboxypeptidase
MNRRAREIGMTATRFANPTGLAPSGGVTTARDMATLARYIIRRYPDRYRLFSTRSIRWEGRSRPNHNQLLGKVRGVDGVKTGYTVPAGYNLAASSVRKGRRVIVVVLGARTAAARDLLVANLLESGFSSPRGGNRARTVVPARHRR